jgi:FkbM family methyltransferase
MGVGFFYCPLFSFFPKSKRIVTVKFSFEKENFFSVDLDLNDPPQFTMIIKKWFDLGSSFLIWKLLKEGDAFVDVGANNGYLSAVASQKVGNSGIVLAIEPNKKAYQKLKERNLVNVVPLNYAVTDVQDSRLELKKSFFSETTSSYFLPGKGSTPGITLDYLYDNFKKPNIKLVKIDTEGAEILVINGAKNMLFERSPYIIMEVTNYSKRFGYSQEDLYRKMKEIGYDNYYDVDDFSVKPLGKEDFLRDSQILFSKKKIEKTEF